MADVVVRSTQPTLAAIKLTWWRDRLEELDRGKIPAEPRLQKVAEKLLPWGVTGRQVARLTEGWEGLLQDPIDHMPVAEHGVVLFDLLAGISRQGPPKREFGLVYGVLRAARLGFPLALDVVPTLVEWANYGRAPRSLRRITMLAALAARDLKKRAPSFEPEATPARAWTLVRHRLTGHLPR